jgi:uncharacterized protein (TIGR02444 family)
MPAKREIEKFWDFSVRTYRTDGVPDACLSLQNDHGADVNMLLYCCWVGVHSGSFDTELFASASEFSSHWAKHVVAPLRSARTWMKHTGCTAVDVPTDACMTLRDEIKAVEFASEKLQQEVLETLAVNSQTRSAGYDQVLQEVTANLELYANFAGIDISADVMQKFSIIVSAAYPK